MDYLQGNLDDECHDKAGHHRHCRDCVKTVKPVAVNSHEGGDKEGRHEQQKAYQQHRENGGSQFAASGQQPAKDTWAPPANFQGVTWLQGDHHSLERTVKVNLRSRFHGARLTRTR